MKITGIISGIFGLTGVLLGAFGAHALKDLLLAHGTADAWDTAVRYQLVHAVALLVIAGWRGQTGSSANASRDWLHYTARCWAAGLVLFSGSLYGYALGGPHALVFVTPVGGLLLALGWVALLVHVAKLPA